MTEKLSPFREAMVEYKGNVSTIFVTNINPAGLENLFEGFALADSVLFKKGEKVTFKYYSVPESSGTFTPGIATRYPVVSGLAYIDGSVHARRKLII